MKTIKEMTEYINDVLKNSFIGQEIILETLTNIEKEVHRICKDLAGPDHERINFSLEREEKRAAVLRPNNLYTAVTLMGVSIPYSDAFEKDCYELENGVKVSLGEKGRVYIQPPVSLGHIDIKLELEKDKNEKIPK